MKKISEIRFNLSTIILVVLAGFLFNSCSKLQNNVLAPVTYQVGFHPSGWATVNSENFHGTYIKDSLDYNLSSCATCHAADFKGGTTGVSCYTCHKGPQGPESCNTCHGSAANPAPPVDLEGDTSTSSPGVGAHQAHLLGSNLASAVSCGSCHLVPQVAARGVHPTGTRKATIDFSGVALTMTNTQGSRYYDSTAATITPNPKFDPQTLKCSNTYCHGDFVGGNNFSPSWTGGASQATCGTCHGIPPNTPIHQGQTLQTCYFCHSPMIGPDGTIQDSTLHVTGKLVLYGKQVSAW